MATDIDKSIVFYNNNSWHLVVTIFVYSLNLIVGMSASSKELGVAIVPYQAADRQVFKSKKMNLRR